MALLNFRRFLKVQTRCPDSLKVTIVGALGHTGQPLAMLLKQCPLIDELCLHDMKCTKGLVQELNHIDTRCEATGYSGDQDMEKALKDSKIVVLLASVTRGHMQCDSVQFEQNAPMVFRLSNFLHSCCPQALLAVGINPINSMVPLISEVLRSFGIYDPNKIFGMTTANCVRANTLAAAALGLDAECVKVPVVGGHSEATMVPVWSQTKPCAEFSSETVTEMTKMVRLGTSDVSAMKTNHIDSLTGAFSFTRFVASLVKGLRGFPNVTECTYVRSNVHPQLKYLTTPVVLGPLGVRQNLGLPVLNDYETCLFDNMIPTLVQDIRRGEKFLRKENAPC